MGLKDGLTSMMHGAGSWMGSKANGAGTAMSANGIDGMYGQTGQNAQQLGAANEQLSLQEAAGEAMAKCGSVIEKVATAQ